VAAEGQVELPLPYQAVQGLGVHTAQIDLYASRVKLLGNQLSLTLIGSCNQQLYGLWLADLGVVLAAIFFLVSQFSQKLSRFCRIIVVLLLVWIVPLAV